MRMLNDIVIVHYFLTFKWLQLEELRADIVDLKEMYREQVNLLVNKVFSFVFESLSQFISQHMLRIYKLC